LCEKVGADASEVEKGLKSDVRIGQRAYLKPGGPYAGGTLARDVGFLNHLSSKTKVPGNLLKGIQLSNQAHQSWTRRKLKESLRKLKGKQIGLLGLTYKPDTSTLRCSSSLMLSKWLNAQGAKVRAYDPAIKKLPKHLESQIDLVRSSLQAVTNSDAVVVQTEWREFQKLKANDVARSMSSPVVIDANRFLSAAFERDSRFKYITVGKPV